MNAEYEKEFLKKLESTILNYKEKIDNKEYSDRLLFSLLSLDDMHNVCGFGYAFDYNDFVFKHMSFAEHINNIGLEKNIILNSNINSFREFYIENVLPLCEFIAKNFSFEREGTIDNIKDEDVRPLVNDFIKYSDNINNKDLLDRFYRERRIMNGYLNDLASVTFFDTYSKDNDYICIGGHTNNYQKGCSIAHEVGHVEELLNIPLKEKEQFLKLSPYRETFSHSSEFLMHDFLIDENISKVTGQSLKSDSIKSLLNHSLNSAMYFANIGREDIDLVQEVMYSCGMMIGFYLNNCSREEYKTFRKLHYNKFDVELVKQMNINKDKMIKVLSKEIEKVKK